MKNLVPSVLLLTLLSSDADARKRSHIVPTSINVQKLEAMDTVAVLPVGMLTITPSLEPPRNGVYPLPKQEFSFDCPECRLVQQKLVTGLDRPFAGGPDLKVVQLGWGSTGTADPGHDQLALLTRRYEEQWKKMAEVIEEGGPALLTMGAQAQSNKAFIADLRDNIRDGIRAYNERTGEGIDAFTVVELRKIQAPEVEPSQQRIPLIAGTVNGEPRTFVSVPAQRAKREAIGGSELYVIFIHLVELEGEGREFTAMLAGSARGVSLAEAVGNSLDDLHERVARRSEAGEGGQGLDELISGQRSQ